MTLDSKALAERLQACADDPMWADHAEVPKRLCSAAATALTSLSALSLRATGGE